MRERGRSAIQIGSPRTIAACSALGSCVVSIVYGPALGPAVGAAGQQLRPLGVAHRDLDPVRVGEHLHATRRRGQHALDVRRSRERARELAAPLGGEQPPLVLAAQQVGGDRVGQRRVPPPQRARGAAAPNACERRDTSTSSAGMPCPSIGSTAVDP